ncbi:MAG: hypothetical protein AAF743_07010, partial [Planctomycetota bacterium]
MTPKATLPTLLAAAVTTAACVFVSAQTAAEPTAQTSAEPTITDVSADYTWRNVPVGGGGFFVNAVPHPTRPGVLYINSDMTGPYIRQAPGEPFVNSAPFNRSMYKDETMVAGLSALAISPLAPDRVFVSVRGSGLMRSEDGGKTFETVHEPSSFTKKNGPTIAIDPHNADVVFRGTDDDGLFRSTEGGAPGTFEKVTVTDEAQKADGDGEETHLVIFPNGTEPVDGRSPLVYAAVMNVGLHVSQDGGDTWQLVAENETDPEDAGPA